MTSLKMNNNQKGKMGNKPPVGSTASQQGGGNRIHIFIWVFMCVVPSPSLNTWESVHNRTRASDTQSNQFERFAIVIQKALKNRTCDICSEKATKTWLYDLLRPTFAQKKP